ncbi:MAG: phosphoglycolate phosphatase [Thermoplasmataceae archaeon]
MIKKLILDIDGTITNMDFTIEPETLLALRRVQKSGISIDLCSGNVLPVMIGIRNIIGIRGYLAAENSGIILADNVIHKEFSLEIPMNVLRELMSKLNVSVPLSNRWRETSLAFNYSGEMEPVKEIVNKYPVTLQYSKFAYHILNLHQDKGYALRKIIEMSSVSPDEILVCGDSENDISMFTKDVNKAAISNSDESLKKLADYVSDEESGFGLVNSLRHFGLLP